MNAELNKLLRDFAETAGLSLYEVERAVREIIDSNQWKRDTLFEHAKRNEQHIKTWPKWKQDFCRDYLNRPFVPDEERGEDINPRW